VSRIDTRQTQPIVNYIDIGSTTWQRYSDWLHAAGYKGSRLGERPVQTAKRVMGKQDFCWTGSVRNWIWEREFPVNFGGQVETWKWRLFVSKRGMVLEIEDKHQRPWGESIKIAAKQALNHFLTAWEQGDPHLAVWFKELDKQAKEGKSR